jgi:formate dehydrogenase iron-sulfur subunit
MSQAVTVYVPNETTAVSLGANDVAAKISALDGATVLRNGSWGACWLEPLVEVVVGNERIAYGPVTPEDVDSLVAADFLHGGDHGLRLGPISEIPYLIRQDRWTFFRVGLIESL